MKSKDFDELISQMGACQRCMNIKKGDEDCSLINIYEQEEFGKNIPSIWTDWYSRLDADIMIFGQDWGPYEDMKKLNKRYLENKVNDNWLNLIESEKSLTKKMLTKYMIESAKLNSVDDYEECMNMVFVTNAIMCARKGTNYRGNNIKLKECTMNCSEYLKKQIDIVKPKVIVTLGYYPLLSLANIYDFSISKTLGETIDKLSEIEIEGMIIIPLYHPTAQVSRDRQLEQYMKIWKYIKKGGTYEL